MEYAAELLNRVIEGVVSWAELGNAAAAGS